MISIRKLMMTGSFFWSTEPPSIDPAGALRRHIFSTNRALDSKCGSKRTRIK